LIGTRLAVALALALSVAAVALGVYAVFASWRDDDDPPGRAVQTRLTRDFQGEPLVFPLDDFYASRGADGRLYALYVYPPGYFGHVRGCRVIWDGSAVTSVDGRSFGPGLFIDPCGGARFARDGALISGPADRGLDRFPTSAGIEGTVVDTHELLCGPVVPTPTPTASPRPRTVTPSPAATAADVRCERVSANDGG
jgi:hypothetical protein